MMSFFAKELQDRLQSAGGNEQSTATPAIDIALTSQPYFYLKSKLITDSEAYIDKDYKNDEPLHVHLIGYDTLIRLLDTKYYPPSHSLSVLEPLFTSHRLRVHMRPGEWGETKKQYEWVARLAGSADEDGSLEKLGGKKEWVDKIELVGAEEGKGVGVSSSRVRKEASAEGSLDGLVPESITRFISEKGLYRD